MTGEGTGVERHDVHHEEEIRRETLVVILVLIGPGITGRYCLGSCSKGVDILATWGALAEVPATDDVIGDVEDREEREEET